MAGRSIVWGLLLKCPNRWSRYACDGSCGISDLHDIHLTRAARIALWMP